MALGVGLLFPPGADGRPRAMYVADLRAECPSCGFGCTRRYYLSARFHSLTLARLERLLHEMPLVMDGECEQCDQRLDEASVRAWSLLISPGDGIGLLQGLCALEQKARWRVYPHEHLDVQRLPSFEFEEDRSAVELECLDERSFFPTLSRYWCAKSALRRFLVAESDESWADFPSLRHEGNRVFRLTPAPGLDLWIGPNADGGAEEDTIDEASSSWELLVEDGDLAYGWPDAPSDWLADLRPLLRGRDVIAVASMDAVEIALRTHFGRFPVDIRYERAGAMLEVIAGDGDTPTSRLRFALDEIAHEAARTCAAPGDIARVEIDRALSMLHLASMPKGDPSPDDLVAR